MSKQTHTPGPWIRGDAYDCGKGYAICAGHAVLARVVGNGYPVGIGAHPESDANARLIAAAPSLFDACASAYHGLDFDRDDVRAEAIRKSLGAALRLAKLESAT